MRRAPPAIDAAPAGDSPGADEAMRRGLTLGKYAPLHRGHQLVIETGLSEMDEMIVLVYDAPGTTSIPLPVRSGWIRALHPTARVVEAWQGPQTVGYSPEIQDAHETYVRAILGETRITHFYSSEPYGEHMSRALGAIDRRVDDGRQQVPISATAIRADAFRHREHVPPLVYRDLITNVVFLGAPCSGKTTLARHLARELETTWMPELGREYWEAHQVGRRLSPAQLVEIAERHLEQEDSLLLRANRYLFTDTNALTTATFARSYHGTVEPRLAALADRASARYDLVFVCDIDIPYEDTGDRSGAVARAAFQRQVIGDLNRRRVPYFLLRGSVPARAAQVRRVLDRLPKFGNVLDLLPPGHP